MTTRTVKTKDVVMMATLSACKRAHVLYHAQYRHVDFVEEVDASDCVAQGEILWCGDDDGACELNALRDCQLYIARAGRQVQDEKI